MRRVLRKCNNIGSSFLFERPKPSPGIFKSANFFFSSGESHHCLMTFWRTLFKLVGNWAFKNCKINFFLSPGIGLSPTYVRYFEHRKVRRRLEVKSEVSSATTAWFLRLLSLFDQNLTSTPTANRQPSGQQDTPSSKIPKVVNIFASDLRPNILLKNK